MQNDRDPSPSLAEAAQAITSVLEECHAELAFLKQREEGDTPVGENSPEVPIDDEGDYSAEEQVVRVAKRLEAAAGALRETASETR